MCGTHHSSPADQCAGPLATYRLVRRASDRGTPRTTRITVSRNGLLPSTMPPSRMVTGAPARRRTVKSEHTPRRWNRNTCGTTRQNDVWILGSSLTQRSAPGCTVYAQPRKSGERSPRIQPGGLPTAIARGSTINTGDGGCRRNTSPVGTVYHSCQACSIQSEC